MVLVSALHHQAVRLVSYLDPAVVFHLHRQVLHRRRVRCRHLHHVCRVHTVLTQPLRYMGELDTEETEDMEETARTARTADTVGTVGPVDPDRRRENVSTTSLRREDLSPFEITDNRLYWRARGGRTLSHGGD